MEIHTHKVKEKDRENLVNLDFDDSVEIEFRPITSGLGFHHDGRDRISYAKVQGQKARTQNVPVGLKFRPQLSAPQLPKGSSGLEAFYSKNENVKKLECDFRENEKKEYQDAGYLQRIFSHFIDLIFVITLTALLPFGMFAASRIGLGQIISSLQSLEMITYGICFFTVLYFLYFSILDLGGTIGKALLGLKLVSTDQKNLTMRRTFFRSFISLCSLVLLGLPFLFDVTGKLSDTRVVKDV